MNDATDLANALLDTLPHLEGVHRDNVFLASGRLLALPHVEALLRRVADAHDASKSSMRFVAEVALALLARGKGPIAVPRSHRFAQRHADHVSDVQAVPRGYLNDVHLVLGCARCGAWEDVVRIETLGEQR